MSVERSSRRRRGEPLRAAPVVDVRTAPAAPIDLTVSVRRRILLVDDEPDVRGYLRIALEPLRWDVNAARNVEEGLEMAVRLLPDVVLLDQLLPDGRGIELGRWLRANQPSMTLVMFSAYLDVATEEEAIDLGITTISKVDNRALFATLAAIRQGLDEQARERAAEVL